MDPRDWRFPMACPLCRVEAGKPVRVVTDAAVLVVEVRCESCRHDWALSAPSPALLFHRKDDRRHPGSVDE
ncbi:MAG TPA: hypothetical protein VM096_16215 [Vicinamibacterales bacterium]|nr:hypothetical protein [Vicinamibacterales bacterium]